MARKKQTVLIVLGISFGTMLFVSISGVQLGMREYISEQLLNNTAHILISGAEREILPAEVRQALYPGKELVQWLSEPAGKREESRLENYQGWYSLLENSPEVFDFSPRLSTNALLANGKFSVSSAIIGIDPDRHVRTTNIESYIKQGSFSDLKGGASNIILGSGVAKDLGVKLDQVVQISAGDGSTRPFKVVGVLHYGNDQVDKSIAFAHIKNIQTLTKNPGRVSEIAVALVDIDSSGEIAEFWKSRSHDKVQDWKEANKSFMEMIQVQDFSRYFITIAILIVAAFGIYNVLTIMINQKKKEIAILRAIGYSPKRILQLILYQGIVLGFSGGLLGLLLGYLMCLWVGSIDFNFEIGDSNNLLISYNWDIYFVAFLSANISSLIASYIPAWEASRMTPMEIIRSES